MRIKKAILTGGGRATRLYPITATINKHLLPLANKPMIFHAIEKVVAAGIEEIFINTNPGDTELEKQVGDGSRWGVSITFFEQRGGPQGIAHVVNEAKKFIGQDPFMFYLSDNILLGGVTEMVRAFETGEYDCMLALSSVKDPERFGVPVFDEDGKLTDVWEKPEHPPNQLAVTGIYLYGSNVFFDAFSKIEKSARGEYEISSIHSYFLKHEYRVGYREMTGWWKDTGKPDDLILANELLLGMMAENEFTREGVVEPGARITGLVRIGRNAEIGANVEIVGPAVIGDGCVLDDCVIKPYVSLGAGSNVSGGATIEKSMIFDHVTIAGPVVVRESLIGRGAVIKKAAASGVSGSVSGERLILGDKTVVELA